VEPAPGTAGSGLRPDCGQSPVRTPDLIPSDLIDPLRFDFVENQDRTFSNMPEDNHNFPENFLT